MNNVHKGKIRAWRPTKFHIRKQSEISITIIKEPNYRDKPVVGGKECYFVPDNI